ncbi:MAG: type I 3-dehydroquinate dehydratase, partial [Deltaproteobacteria bacterium]|nr:type I 3-dehydroquinate dehydratase [Deltaproteobacteria bacterium]
MAIVVSHIAADFETLCRRALRQAPLADVVELRLDRVGHPGKEALAGFMAACPKPVIVACHGAEAYGEFQGTAEEVFDLYHDAAEAG